MSKEIQNGVGEGAGGAADPVERMARRLAAGDPRLLAVLRETLAGTARTDGPEQKTEQARVVEKGPDDGVPDPREPWAARVVADLEAMEPGLQTRWRALLANMPQPKQGKPTAKWLKAAMPLVDAVGAESVQRYIPDWIANVTSGGLYQFSDRNGEILKGLVWYASLAADRDVVGAIGKCAAAVLSYTSPGTLLCSKVGNSALRVFAEIATPDAVGQLAWLKRRVRSPWALEEIDKAIREACAKAGLTADELEELSAATFDLDASGVRTMAFDNGVTATVKLDAGTVHVEWIDGGGNPIVLSPAEMKKAHPAAEKAVRDLTTEMRNMLGVHRDRIERGYMRRNPWPYAVWRERYIDHVVVGSLARRLIWTFGEPGIAGIYRNGGFVGIDGRLLPEPASDAPVRLWHPIDCDARDVLSWRTFLEAAGVTQPFKQTYREVYVLTDAERQTAMYSNRFAAHILRQHQFQALCRQRGWSFEYRGWWGPVDNGADRKLPEWGLSAEFWVQSAGEDQSDAGVSLYIATDQVRFYEGGQETVALETVPPVVFSEVMRDVDLFAGVCSIGNDPQWRDAGADGGRADYWRAFSFGELSESARTRRAVLERLIPRLAIADRCTLRERFLVVRGALRTYMIHLGSGNVLMEPNDQYLCIVKDSRKGSEQSDRIYLPFEGDATLTLIVSKALMLAADDKIRDRSIISQIKSGL
jgi:hypothetical protein